MKECSRIKNCPLIVYCAQNNSSIPVSIEGIVKTYCCSNKQRKCIRKRLLEKYGETSVPRDMMPNGFPLPGAKREKWSQEAINFRNLL